MHQYGFFSWSKHQRTSKFKQYISKWDPTKCRNRDFMIRLTDHLWDCGECVLVIYTPYTVPRKNYASYLCIVVFSNIHEDVIYAFWCEEYPPDSQCFPLQKSSKQNFDVLFPLFHKHKLLSKHSSCLVIWGTMKLMWHKLAANVMESLLLNGICVNLIGIYCFWSYAQLWNEIL